MVKTTVRDVTTEICGALTDMGMTYDCEFDNRGGNRSDYIFVRKPFKAKLRVSDHPSKRLDAEIVGAKTPTFNVRVGNGPFGVSKDEALSALRAIQNDGFLEQYRRNRDEIEALQKGASEVLKKFLKWQRENDPTRARTHKEGET